MDERKKEIKELETQKRDTLAAVDGTLESLGASLLPRLEDAEYRGLLEEIGNSELAIAEAEGDIRRLKLLEEEILEKEEKSAQQAKDIAAFYTRMGELTLEEPGFESYSQPYRGELETLVPKIKSLENRLELLDERGEGNVFSWIGKSAKGMVLRSFLGRNQSNLQRIYAAAGEAYALSALTGQKPMLPGVSSGGEPEEEPAEPPSRLFGNPELSELLEKIGAARKGAAEINQELSALREERRRINKSFSAEGGPAKKIQILERQIAEYREKQRAKHLRRGREAEQAVGEFTPEEEELLEKVRVLRETAADLDRRIEKLQAALDIEEEQKHIEKMEKAILEYRQRIAAEEEAIGDLTKKIQDSNLRIEELSLKL
jgi:chromosome segregation ATPase